MQATLPPQLRPGDTIAIVAPSAPAFGRWRARARRGIDFLTQMGYRVRLMPHARARSGHQAGTARERAEDLNLAFRDPSVRLVLSAMGGWNSNAVLPHLDYDALRADPKLVQGHSDVTALLQAVTLEAGVVSILGPQLVPHFGRPTGPNWDTLAWWLRIAGHPTAPGPMPHPELAESSYPGWETVLDRLGPQLAPNPPRVAHRARAVEGRLVAGNLVTLEALAGTRFWPRFDGSILAWEEKGEQLGAIERSLVHLREAGAFEGLRGMAVGKPFDCPGTEGQALQDMLLRVTRRYDFPILTGLDFGHGEPFLSLPVGARAAIDDDASFHLLEPAVRLPSLPAQEAPASSVPATLIPR
ncbi:MAG: LD-carboxypeptidase [Halobacteriales archaeon]|nr:LD-carboxypeptidase [Halobacteriales archaeon]